MPGHVSRRSHTDGLDENVDYIFLFDDHKRFIVQITAVVAAVTSLILVSIAFFWFIRMRKRFRHKYYAPPMNLVGVECS